MFRLETRCCFQEATARIDKKRAEEACKVEETLKAVKRIDEVNDAILQFATAGRGVSSLRTLSGENAMNPNYPRPMVCEETSTFLGGRRGGSCTHSMLLSISNACA